MKKYIISGMIVLSIISMASCRAGSNPETPSSTGSTVGAFPSTPVEIADPYVSYLEVLQGKSKFYNVTSGEYLDIAHLKDALTPDNLTLTIKQFAVEDLDNDGIEEVILRLSLAENDQAGFEILHAQDGSIYGYTLVYRAFSDLKADGTFIFSSGASDWGIGRISFTTEGYEVDKITYCESSSFFVDHKKSTEESFLKAVENQNAKEDATWYDFAGNDFSVLSK